MSRDISGAEIDNYGRWVDVAPYGRVWSPSNAGQDWRPYTVGHWAFTDDYGWNWVSEEDWGHTCYHYGRWFNSSPYGWCWYPGPVYGRHYWSPALVAFFGFGGFHVGVGFGGAGFGWVPLAPYEPFHRWWGRGFYGGYRNHNVLVNNIHCEQREHQERLRNARIGNGASVVNSGDFGRGRMGNISRIFGDQLRQASLVRPGADRAKQGKPARFRPRNRAIPRSNAAGGRFFSHNQPSQVNRVPFTVQQQSLAQINRQGSAGSERASGVAAIWAAQVAQLVARRGRNPCGNRREVRRARDKQDSRRPGWEFRLVQMPVHEPARKAGGGARANLAGRHLP